MSFRPPVVCLMFTILILFFFYPSSCLVKPSQLKIEPTEFSSQLTAGDVLQLRCLAIGARPEAQISWYRSLASSNSRTGSYVSSSSDQAGMSQFQALATGTSLQISLTADDHTRRIRCVATIPQMPEFRMHSEVKLNVQCMNILYKEAFDFLSKIDF